jgi:hypothetical protein
MIKFNSKYIEEQVRRVLSIKERALTAEDLLQVSGILINDSDDYSIPVVWYMDSSAFAMTIPNLHLNHSKLMKSKGWEQDFKLFTNIKSFYCYKPVPLDVVSSFKNLTDLEFHDTEISDWSFLAELNNLRMIYLHKCGNTGDEAVRHLGSLHTDQNNTLQYIALTKMGVSDLSPFKQIKCLTELNLSYNAISDTSALADMQVFCLNLKGNNLPQEYWRIESITYKNGRPRLDKGYPKYIGTVVADVEVGVMAYWSFVYDAGGYPVSGGWRTSRVEKVGELEDGVMRIYTLYSVYTLRRLSEEEVKELL